MIDAGCVFRMMLRRETAFSPESAAGSSEAGSNRSPFCSSSREAQIVGEV